MFATKSSSRTPPLKLFTCLFVAFSLALAASMVVAPTTAFAKPGVVQRLSAAKFKKIRMKFARHQCLKLQANKRTKLSSRCKKQKRSSRATAAPVFYTHLYDTVNDVRVGNFYQGGTITTNQSICLVVQNVYTTISKVIFHIGPRSYTVRLEPQIWMPLCVAGNVNTNVLPIGVNPGQYLLGIEFYDRNGVFSGWSQFNVRIVAGGVTGASLPTPTPSPTRTPTVTPSATPIPILPTPTTVPTVPPAPGRLLIGFDNIRSDFNNLDLTVRLLRDEMRTNSVRGWMTLNVNAVPNMSDFNYYRELRNRGLITVVTFNLPEHSGWDKIPTAAQTRLYFQRAIAASAGAIDYWSIGNELNIPHYWPGTFDQYMNQLLIPASEELRRAGQLVVGASISWDVARVRELVNKGMLNHVDAVAYHPYAPDAAGTISRVNEVLSFIQGKPLFLTEFNTYTNQNMWDGSNQMLQVKNAFAGIKDRVGGIWYYNASYRNDQAGVGAPYDGYGNRRFPYFCTLFAMFTGGPSTLAACR